MKKQTVAVRIVVVILSVLTSALAFSRESYQEEKEVEFSKFESFICNFQGNVLNPNEAISYDNSEDNLASKILGQVKIDFKAGVLSVNVPGFESTQPFEIFENDLATYLLKGVAAYHGLVLTPDIGASAVTSNPKLYLMLLPQNKIAQIRMPLNEQKELIGHCLPE